MQASGCLHVGRGCASVTQVMDVRHALLQAAVKVFAEAGLRGATTRRIAREAGVNEVTLFRHFKSKDDLITSALQQFARQSATRELPLEPVDPRAELITWCRAHHRDLHRVRALIRKTMGEFEERPDFCAHGMEASVRIAQELSAYLCRLRERGLAAGPWDEWAVSAMLMGAIFADAMGRDTMPRRYPYSMQRAIEQYVDLTLAAISAKRPGRARRPALAGKSS